VGVVVDVDTVVDVAFAVAADHVVAQITALPGSIITSLKSSVSRQNCKHFKLLLVAILS
jgi:hypothetical protein